MTVATLVRLDHAGPAFASTAAPLVSVRGLARRFGPDTVLADLDLDIAEGEFVALLGRSGSGKTTLLRTIAGLDQPDEGEVVAPAARAVVFQEARLLPWRHVWRNVALGLRGAGVRARATAALAEVGLTHRAEAWPLTLSGGEAQRVALARALVREPRLLLLDEPFAALDALTRLRMQDLVRRLRHAHGCAALMVTHDVDEALLLADRVVVLDQGRIARTERIDPDAPRTPDRPAHLAARVRLLRQLGVGEPIGSETA